MNLFKKILLIIILIALIAIEIWILERFPAKYLRYGVIDRSGEPLFDFNYLMIDSDALFSGDKSIKAYKANMFGETKEITYIDTNGNEYLVSSQKNHFDPIRPYYNENIACIEDEDTEKCGYIDANGNMITDFKYDIGYNFENGYAKVGMRKNAEETFGVIDSTGKEILPCKYDSINLSNAEYGILYADLGDEDSIFDKDGNKIADYNEDETISFIDLNDLTELGKLESDDIEFTKNYFIISKDDKAMFFDKKGNKLKDYEFEKASNISSGELFLVEKDGERKIIDPTNGYSFNCEPIESKGYEIMFIESGRIGVRKDGKLGVVDSEGNVIIEPIYSVISNKTAVKGFFSVDKDGEYGVFDIDGNEIIKCSNKYYDSILGDGNYFVVRVANNKLLAMWITYLVIITIIEIIVIMNILKRKK